MDANLFQKIAHFASSDLELDVFAHYRKQMLNVPEAAVLIADPETDIFITKLLAAVCTRHSVILANAEWGMQEWQQVYHLFDVQSGTTYIDIMNPTGEPLILIPTGGTSGNIKFVMHTWQTIAPSVQGFQDYFDVSQINSFCILPCYHVSGLMQLMRSLLSDGRFVLGDYGALKRGILPELDVSKFCLSLVPTQLQRLLKICPEWLAQFQLVLLGGAPPWRSLLELARSHRIQLALSYGMTETAANVVALRPNEFLAGKEGIGKVLPHVHIDRPLTQNSVDVITLRAKSLFMGYYPQFVDTQSYQTDDLGYFDQENNWHIVGRQSQKIITGGENVFPEEVETIIKDTGLVNDVAVLGWPDQMWGEVVIAAVVLNPGNSIDTVQQAIASQLSPYKQPKRWFCLSQLPRNTQGKLNQTILREKIGKDYH